MPIEKTAKTITALAAAISRSRGTVNKYLKRDDWPFGPKPPWNIREVQAWIIANLRRDAGGVVAQLDMSERTEADLLLKRQRARKLKLETDLLAGKVHEVAECNAKSLAKIHAVKSGLLSLPRQLAPVLINQTDQRAVEDIIETRIRQILAAYSRGWDGDGAIEEAP